ncbi:MAG: GAF domain-containing protein [Vicinamibacterales bacterium]
MSDTFDEQLRRAFDAIAERMRTTVTDHVSVAVEQLSQSAAAERTVVAETAARQAAEAAEQATRERLAAEFSAREEQIREAARAEWFEAGLQQARSDAAAAQQAREAEAAAAQQAREAEAQAQAEAAARLVEQHEQELAAVRAEASARLDAALTAARVDSAAIAAGHEQALAALRSELESVQAALVEAAARQADELARAHAAAEQSSMDHAAALAVAHAAAALATQDAESARAAAQAAEGRIERASVERLLAAIRALDGTTSLSQTLDALASAARAEADRTAVFLVRGESLRAWNHAGFAAIPDAGTFEVAGADAGVALEAVRTARAQRVNGEAAGRPAFAGSDSGAFVAVPLSMNGQVIAVLCGDQAAATDQGEWLAMHYEVLARHAARVLESLTALRLAQLGAHPAAAGVAAPPQ